MNSLSAAHHTDPGQDHPEGLRLSRGVGLASVGLGALQAVFSRSKVVKAVGVGDVALGLGILLRPRRAAPMWLRVAADAVSLGALVWAARQPRGRTRAVAGLLASAVATGVDLYATRQVTRAQDRASPPVMASVTIHAKPADVYRFFRDFESLPLYMDYLESVTEDGDHSHWVMKLPVGHVSWDAELLEDRPGECLVWRATGTPFSHRGRITFARSPGGESTEVRAEVELAVRGMSPSATLAKALTRPQIKGDLRRLKQVIETGEVLK